MCLGLAIEFATHETAHRLGHERRIVCDAFVVANEPARILPAVTVMKPERGEGRIEPELIAAGLSTPALRLSMIQRRGTPRKYYRARRFAIVQLRSVWFGTASA